MELKKVKASDFAKFHPGGNLGKRLTLTTGQMAQVNPKPSVHTSTPLKEVILVISKNRLGAAVVIDENEKVFRPDKDRSELIYPTACFLVM